MLSKKCITLFIIICIVAITSSSYAANLRGRVDGLNQYTGDPYPIGNAVVDLYFQGPYGWKPIAKYITGFNGMYFFQNIIPGAYVLQINGRQNYPVTVYNQPFQDLPPILIQY